MDLITDIMPNTSDAISWNKDNMNTALNLVSDIRKNNGVRNMFNKQIKNLPQVKLLEQIKQNAIADLKSGNFYNKDRTPGGSFGDDGDFGFDDDLFGDVNVQFIDDEGETTEFDSESPTGDNGSRPPIAVINTMPLAKAVQSSTEATIETMSAIAGQQLAVENEKIMFNQQSVNSILSGLNSINDNLALLVEFNADSTAKFHGAAIKYYEQSIEMMSNQDKENKQRKVKETLDLFTSKGSVKLEEYIKHIKQNLVDIKDENAMLGQFVDTIMDPMMLQGLASSPGMIIPEMIKGIIPKYIKSTLGDLDKNLSSLGPAILAKIGSFENSDSPFLQMINKVFGFNPKISKDIDLGDYEKGAIQWDGESKKALVEVIPSYLRRIESALTGEEERIFNYKKGKFDTRDNIKKSYDEAVKDAEISGYADFKFQARDLARKFELSEKAMAEFEEDLLGYLAKMTNAGKMIRPGNRKDADGFEFNEFIDYEIAGGDPDRQKFLEKIIRSMDKKTLTEAWTAGIRDSVERTNKAYDEMRGDSTYASLYNDTDKEGKLRYSPDKLKGGIRDAFGLTNLDYLRDIRSLLIKGIRVFPDNRKRFKEGKDDPSREFALKEKYEEQQRVETEKKMKEEANKKIKQYSTHGKSIEETAYISNDEWLNTVGVEEFIYDENTKTGKAMKKVKKLSDKVGDKVFEILMGDEDYIEQLIKKYDNRFGNGKPVIQNIKEMFGDTSKAVMSYFTGQPYVTSDGVQVEGNENAIFGKITKFFTGTMEKLKGKEDGEDGVIGKFISDISEGFNKFKTSLFGDKALSEQDTEKTHTNIMKLIKERLPKAVGYGYGSAVVKTLFASKMGILGNFLLPGGGLSAALIGTAYGFLKQSETYNRFMFGELDENGERKGGLISKAWQDKYKEHASTIKKGAGIGIVGSLLLPGGPVLGGLVGIGASFAAKNEAFQEFLFGKDFKTDEKKSMMNGAFGRVFKKFTGDSDPKLAKFLGTAGLGVGIAQGVGLLPSFLLPGGPIMGSLLGLAGGIAASSDKFQEFLLGEKDVDGQRYGGLLHKVTNWFDITFARPLAIKMTEINDKIYGFMRKKVFDPIARSFEPMVYAVKNVAIDIKNGIVDAFSKVTNPIVEAFKDYVIKPVSKILKKTIVDPIKWMLKKTFGLIGKSILGVLTAPLGIINLLGKSADKYNAHAEVRHEQRNRRRAYDKDHKDGTWNYWDRRAAGKMTKEEKQELINEKLKYRDGKTWRQRKKEQKKDYKDEMARRKEKRDAMIKQYEEDKKFAKENGFKYRSKKQKEQREQQLREKEAWIQEQQLMQAQETTEKVSNISDNVIQLAEYQDKTSSKLDTITNTVKEGFNKLADKLGFENNKSTTEQEEDHMSKIYDFLDNEVSKDENVTLKEALDGLKGEFKELADHLKTTDKVDNSTPAGVKPSDIVNISDSDMAKIYKYLDSKVQEDENVTLRGALDNLPEDFKPLFKNKKSITIDTGDNRIVNLNEVRKKLRKDDQSHADGLNEVPKDGYLAELHKGEMVVPEKPAGKLRGLMDKAGKGFKGLTDVLSDVSEDDVDNREENKSSEKESKGLMSTIGGLFGGLTTLIGNMTVAERKDREDNALQLSDMEADRLKELEDLERRKTVMRKGVDFVQSKIAERKKAKDEQNWRDRLINAIKGVGYNVADAGLNLFDMIKNGISGLMDGFGNFGSLLSSLAVPLGVAGLISLGDKYTESEEYIQGRTDVDGTLVSDDYHVQKYRTLFSARDSIFVKPAKALKKKLIDPTVEVSKKIYNSKLGQKVLQPIGSKIKNSKLGQTISNKFGKKAAGTADNVIDFAAAKAARGGDNLAKGAVKGTGKVVNLAEAKLAKEAAESGSGKAVAKVIGEGVEGASSKGGIIQKLITVGKEAVEALAKKAMEKFPKAAKLGNKLLQFVEPAFKALLKNADSILARFAKKITAVFAKIGLGASTAFIADAVFAVGDLVTGFTAGNAGNLFGVSTENVDARMRIISSLIQAVFNFNFMSIISLINEITNMMFNFNFLRQLAIGIYNLTGGKQEFGMRITSKQIDTCKSIDEAVALMGLTPEEIAMLKDGNDWVDFSSVKNEDLGGVISSAEQMELARLQYNLANGTTLNSQAWIDKESKTFGAKAMDGIKKLFTKESAQQKLSKYQTKATTKSTKAAEYREKAANSNNIFSKGWNNSMAWLNEKSAKRAEKKSAKVAAKAPKKKEKAERKVAYYTEKAANAGTLTKWYYNWRKNANEKKVARYTLSADGSQVIQESSIDGSTGSEVTEGAIDKAMTPETFKMLYGTLAEGKTMTDGYGNVYDHNGNVIQDGDGNYYDSQGNLLEDGAGMGYGDRQDYYIDAHRNQKTSQPKAKKKLDIGDTVANVIRSNMLMTPGGAAIALGSKLYGKNKKAEDYTMVPIMDAEGNIVSYQSKLIDDVTEVEGFNTTEVIDTKKTKNQQIIPQVDEKGNVVSFTTTDKNKTKTGLFGRISTAVSNLFGFGGSSSSNSVDNSSSVTNNTGDTYTTNNEIDTTPFGPLTEAINSLVNYDPTDNVDEEGNIKTGGVLSAITNPVGFVTKKLANYGIDVYELTTGKEVAPEDVNKAVTIFNMLSNPLGYLYSKTRDYMTTPDEEGKTRWDKTKDWTSDKWNTAKTFFGNNLETSKKILGKTWNTVTDPVKKYANWVGGEFKEFGDNPWAYTLNSAADLNRNIYFGAKDKITKVKNFATDKIDKAKGWVNDKFGDQISTAKNAVGNFMSDKFGFVTEGVNSDNSLGYNIGRVAGNIYNELDTKKDEMINNVKETISGALDKIGKMFTWVRDEMPKKIQEGIGKVTDFLWHELPNKIGEGVEWAVNKIGEGVEWVKTELPKKVGELKDKFIEGFQKMWKTVTDSVTEKVNDMKETFSKENITRIFTEKVEEVKKAWDNFTDSFGDIFDDIKKHIKLPDISLSLSDLKSFISDLFKGFNDGGSSGAGASGPDSTSYVKPVKHTFSSTELLKPMNSSSSTNNVSNTNNNKFVFYSQSDERWSKDVLGNRTMKDAGCGPTSLAMAISQLTGEQITPDTVAKLGKEHLPGYSQFSLFPSVADKLNMNYDEGYDNSFIVKNLRKGIPVVLSGRTNATGTPYTAEGHVVTASHMSGNNVFIQDPRGEGYSRYYPLTSVLTGLNKGMIITPSSTTNVAKLSSGSISDINLDNQLYKQSMGILGDHGEYISLNEDSGKAGASQVTVADRVLSYARAFLANTSKFSYSQPQRHKIDNNGNKADCSSFVSHVLTVAGDAGKVAGTSQTFWDSIGTKVDNPQIGDVVCQKGHVGLYSGDGNYIHMSGRKYGIKESKAIQKGNNAHRGYKRVLKNPSALVDPTITGGNSLLGTVVATSSGNPVTGEGGTNADGTVSTSQGSVPQYELLGPFAEMNKIANNMVASIFNGKEVDLYAVPETPVGSNDGSTGGSTGGSVDISGETDTAKAVYKFFTGKGYTPAAACGILGNMEQESGVNPKSIQGGGKGPAAGICQWENYNKKSARWKGLSDYASSKGKDWTDLQSQLEWLDMELQGKDSTTLSLLKKKVGGYEQFKALTDVDKATLVFEESFERAGKPNMSRRYSAAKSYYSKFASAGAGDEEGAGYGFTMATSAEAAPSSGIPSSMNGWAYYDQNDTKWQEDISGKKIGPSGCGMASHAMMLTTMFGKQVTPVTVGKWARKAGYWGDGGMAWTMPNAIASKLGLTVTKSNTNGGGLGESDLSNIKSQIKSGYPVILSGKGKKGDSSSPFTSGGHIVLAVGVDGSGNLIINDPRGASYTKAYTDNGVLNSGTGLRGYWAFDKPSSAALPSDWVTGDFTATPGSSGSSSTGGGTTTVSAPQFELLGPFAEMNKIGTNLVASIFNGKEVDMFATAVANTSTSGTTSGSTGTGTGSVTIDENLMLSGTDGFFKALSPAATSTYNQYKNIFPSTILAQAALESAWGKSKVAQSDKNLFGIKWTGKHNPLITVEKGRNCPGGEQGGARPYNRYKSFGDSVLDHGWFLNNNGSRYNATLNAKTPSEQITALGKSGYAEASTYGSKLQNMVNKYDLTKYNPSGGAGNGEGDGKTYMVSPKASYNKSINTGINKTDVNRERELEAITKKVNVAVNNINAADPISYTEILKLIMQELQAINSNTAATASGVNNIEIISANTSVSDVIHSNTTTNKNKANSSRTMNRQTQTNSTGYQNARNIAGYKK